MRKAVPLLIALSAIVYEGLILFFARGNLGAIAASTIPLALAVAGIALSVAGSRVREQGPGTAHSVATTPPLDVSSLISASGGRDEELSHDAPTYPGEKARLEPPDVSFYDAALGSLFKSIVSYLNKTSDPMSESLVAIRKAIAGFLERIENGKHEFEKKDYSTHIHETVEQFREQLAALTGETSETFRVLTQEVVSIGDYMDSIRKLLENISDVAERVHVLSINASIESARAGERGKGFKVISNEIQKLARETQTIVQDITGTVAVSNKVFASINDAVSSHRGRLLKEMARDSSAYESVKKTVDRQVEEVTDLYSYVMNFADELRIDMDTLTPLAMLHSIITQEIENLDLATRDLVKTVGERGNDPEALAAAIKPETAGEKIRTRLTTARELDALEAAMAASGLKGRIDMKRTNTDIEFF